ncbi:beta-lactamase-like protein [Dichotomocladium elegans]|nr:beta-lactamase-like protein [Dichotomocladium elegans]
MQLGLLLSLQGGLLSFVLLVGEVGSSREGGAVGGKIRSKLMLVNRDRQRMEELVAYHGISGSYVQPGSAVGGIPTAAITGGWRFLYNKNNIQACLEKIQSVGYMQEMALFSTVKFVAHSSGYALGAANWVLEVSERKIVLLSSSSIVPNRHPAPFDSTVFNKADVILISDVRQEDPASKMDMMRVRDRIKASTAMAIQYKRNVLFPISTIRNIFDLLEDIRTHLIAMGIPIGVSAGEARFYVVSPIAKMSLEYANICGEWMTPDHHNNLYEAMAPLGYSVLMKNGTLRTMKTLISSPQEKMEFEEPYIMFTGDHICPDKGPLGTILKQRSNANQTMCIITEPDTPPLADTSALHVESMPLDPRTSLCDIASLISMYSRPTPPAHIVIPNFPESAHWSGRLGDGGRSQVHVYRPGEILTVDLNRAWEKLVITEEVTRIFGPPPAFGCSVRSFETVS